MIWGALFSGAVARAGEQVYFFHNDHLGTPQALTDSTGRIVWTAEYDPFGKATVNEDPDGDGQIVTNNLRFPGQYYDAESGLHYNWMRYYDPGTGRYLQPDPIGLAGGLNQYLYVMNNPVSWTDPTGENPLLIPVIVGGIVGTWIWGSGANAPESPESQHLPPQSIVEAGAAAAAGAGAAALLSAAPLGCNLGQVSDWVRWGPTVVSNQLVNGLGSKGASVTNGLKGGGTNRTTGFSLPFRYHIHEYNWYRPWMWFKNTPILK